MLVNALISISIFYTVLMQKVAIFVQNKVYMASIPLAERLRPQNLDEYIGQQHLVGAKGVIRRMIDTGNLSSLFSGDLQAWGKQPLQKL